jgi:hypothetical protein
VNNFKKIQEEDEAKYQQHPHLKKVQSGLWQTLGIFKFIGYLVEVYIPRVVDLFVVAVGGQAVEHKRSDFTIAPSQGKADDPRRLEPSDPDGEEDNDRTDN